MGAIGFFSDFEDWSMSESKTSFPNPDPKKFKIKKVERIGEYFWVLVNYPDCPSFGGDKILIYNNVAIDRIKIYKELDPHFSTTGLSPVARFRPDSDGIKLSIKFCENC